MPIQLGLGVCARCQRRAPISTVLCDDCAALADRFNQTLRMQHEQCPVCGYYCLGRGGIGCIDKPAMCGMLGAATKGGK